MIRYLFRDLPADTFLRLLIRQNKIDQIIQLGRRQTSNRIGRARIDLDLTIVLDEHGCEHYPLLL